jgi:hypothetical protein
MAELTATFTLAVDDPPNNLELPGGCFFSVRCRRGPAGEWEGEREQMGERGGFQRAPSVYIQRSELGPAWVSLVSIGRRGRCLGTAS